MIKLSISHVKKNKDLYHDVFCSMEDLHQQRRDPSPAHPKITKMPLLPF